MNVNIKSFYRLRYILISIFMIIRHRTSLRRQRHFRLFAQVADAAQKFIRFFRRFAYPLGFVEETVWLPFGKGRLDGIAHKALFFAMNSQICEWNRSAVPSMMKVGGAPLRT